MCPPIQFANVQPEQWVAIEAQLRASHIVVSSDVGTTHIGPADIHWDYEPGTRVLTVQCISKPFLVPCQAVNDRLRDAFLRAAH